MGWGLELLAGVGLISLSRTSFRWAHQAGWIGKLSSRRLQAQAGQWAVISGASDGIGAEYAHQLAARGYNLFLLSRTESKLEAIAQDIQSRHSSVQIKTLPIDFSRKDIPSKELFDPVEQIILPMEEPIGILVNNVGVNYAYPKPFLEASSEEDAAIIQVNMETLTRMTKLVLPKMIARQEGVVVNISSLTAQVPTPLLSVYAGSKSFVETLTLNLQEEYHGQGLIFQCVSPGPVATRMSKATPSRWVPSVSVVVEEAIENIGRGVVFTPYLWHRLFRWGCQVLPSSLVRQQMHNFLKSLYTKHNSKESLRAALRERRKQKKK